MTDVALAAYLGISRTQLNILKNAEKVTPAQIANIIEKHGKAQEDRWTEAVVVPIVEFLHIDPTETRLGASWKIFNTKSSDKKRQNFYSSLQKCLNEKHGIYIFHDSRGRAVYAGKAHRTTLWSEINDAFNRDRGDVQSMKRVSRETEDCDFDLPSESGRQIARENIKLHHIASYVSAYEVPDKLIAKFEALIIRGFANDLMNARVERL